MADLRGETSESATGQDFSMDDVAPLPFDDEGWGDVPDNMKDNDVFASAIQDVETK